MIKKQANNRLAFQAAKKGVRRGKTPATILKGAARSALV